MSNWRAPGVILIGMMIVLIVIVVDIWPRDPNASGPIDLKSLTSAMADAMEGMAAGRLIELR